MRLRAYEAADLDAELQVFFASVHVLAVGYYDEAQCAAWAPSDPDPVAWQRRLAGQRCMLAMDERERLLGFIAFDAGGHVDLHDTAPEFARSGVARVLYENAERSMIGQRVAAVITEASLVARPHLRAPRLSGCRTAKRGSAWERFLRFRMLKTLHPSELPIR